LILAAAALLSGPPSQAGELDPHLDRRFLPLGCASCHRGHGAPRSPMLPNAQIALCLDCHDNQARTSDQVRAGRLAPEARPPLLGATLALPQRHALSPSAFSRFDEGAVTCTSCHSAHRRGVETATTAAAGLPRFSTRDPRQLEYDICESCHRGATAETRSPTDLSRLLDTTSRSFHPVHAPANERSRSVLSELAKRQINCTDCHDSSRRDGPRGPHASEIPGLLAANLATTDGSQEQQSTYALCYRCHDRESVLDERSAFPLHRLHVVEQRTACSTCHSPHGSIDNRALIRFGEETDRATVVRSPRADRLAFVSDRPGAGSCYLMCHGVDHAPKEYGGGAVALQAAGGAPLQPPSAGEPALDGESERGRWPRPELEARPKRKGPPPPR